MAKNNELHDYEVIITPLTPTISPYKTTGIRGLPYAVGTGTGSKPTPNQNCKNCAAPLDWNLSKCEYCDTFFSLNDNNCRGMRMPMVYNTDFAHSAESWHEPGKHSIWQSSLLAGAQIAAAIIGGR